VIMPTNSLGKMGDTKMCDRWLSCFPIILSDVILDYSYHLFPVEDVPSAALYVDLE